MKEKIKKKPILFYSRVIAPVGQLAAQAPHSMQASGFATTDLSSLISNTVGVAGHTFTQVPHPVHFSGSTFGGITLPFSLNNVRNAL